MNSKPLTSAERRQFLSKLLGFSASAGLLLTAPSLFAASASKLQKITVENKSGSTHIRFELNQPTQYKVFTLNNPERIIIDFSNTRMDAQETVKNPQAPLKKVRHAVRNDKDLRVVLDMKQAVHVASEMRPIDGGKSYRLSVTLKQSKHKSKVVAATPLKTKAPKSGNFVVAIDAGHGGKDPGAVGKNRTYEKNVVLKISRELKKLVDQHPGMRAVMIRDGDYYLPLRKRIEKARKKKADIFLSIHADANRNRKLTGSSVYILSNNGASSEAAHLLAQRENAYDIANVSLTSHDKKVASVLLDLSQSATLEQSLDLAHGVLDQLTVMRKPFRRKVESAEFQVLKSPDIPSVLVETAFISNPDEEKKLITSTFQKRVAKAIFSGVKKYYASNHLVASRRSGGTYVVKGGDTLSEIAENHGVSTSVLRRHNSLRSDHIYVGQKLKIPAITYEL